MKRGFIFLLMLCFCAMAYGNASAEGAEALVRGNTAVVRIPCDWLYAYELRRIRPEGIYTFDALTKDVDDAWLRDNMSEAEYAAFMADYHEKGAAGWLKIRNLTVPEGYPRKNGRVQMNVRLIDDDWYMVFRQEPIDYDAEFWIESHYIEVYADEHKMAALDAIGDVILTSAIDVKPFDGAASEVLHYGDYTLEVFSVLDANVIVIIDASPDGDSVQDMSLRIGDDIAFDVTGYRSGNQAIYCCVLSDSELAALQTQCAVGRQCLHPAVTVTGSARCR